MQINFNKKKVSTPFLDLVTTMGVDINKNVARKRQAE